MCAMNPATVGVERRAGQRFPYLLPVFIRCIASGVEARGFTQDLSSRGVFFFTDATFGEGAEIELTLKMPSEITLGDDMRVRCRGRVLRVSTSANPPQAGLSQAGLSQAGLSQADPSHASAPLADSPARVGVAVRLEGYEYLPDLADNSALQRVAALHKHPHDPQPDPKDDRPAVSAGLTAR
jgi:hypothetical protein